MYLGHGLQRLLGPAQFGQQLGQSDASFLVERRQVHDAPEGRDGLFHLLQLGQTGGVAQPHRCQAVTASAKKPVKLGTTTLPNEKFGTFRCRPADRGGQGR